MKGVTRSGARVSRSVRHQGPAGQRADRHRRDHEAEPADFGVSWSRTLDGGGVVVSDEVAVTIDVELVAAAPAAK